MYKYELSYSGSFITEEFGFDTEEEAIEEAHAEIEARIDYWRSENAWDEETESINDFEITIEEEISHEM